MNLSGYFQRLAGSSSLRGWRQAEVFVLIGRLVISIIIVGLIIIRLGG